MALKNMTSLKDASTKNKKTPEKFHWISLSKRKSIHRNIKTEFITTNSSTKNERNKFLNE